ncbi:ABC transporter permease [Chitinophaga horti]|uniref:ABC transporter permease n=1 Tax=Chitinophaga horti TaxID=2920382 RepID=A0ABY6J035_9BACT|nr:ABC transporter permease [Chitinophaga horti]UYQ91736.1 ABC transporter permease [Chitinophaga horti]
MIRNYLKIAWRNIVKSKGYAAINIGGLATGMAVALLIGLWIWDEVTYDRHNQHYDRIAQVFQNQDFGGKIDTWQTMPHPTGETLRRNYPDDFKHVVMASWDFYKELTYGDKRLKKLGKYVEPDGPLLMDLQMLRGSRDALKDVSSILLSETGARSYFGDADPVGKVIRFSEREMYTVQGVYRDIPRNSAFANLQFLAPFDAYIDQMGWVRSMVNPWGNNAFLLYVQIADHADMSSVSEKIKMVRNDHLRPEERRLKPRLFLHPMKMWRLQTAFENGVVADGGLKYVWLFGLIGLFVLMLACINFMNLSTARSEKRAREVGIRKAIGSVRAQLVKQFFSESLLVVMLAFVLSLLLVQLALPLFNSITAKQMHIPWLSPMLWLAGLSISFFTALVAGSYPAFYLSSFQPVKVLKGTFRAGRYAAVPRQAMLVLQFTISLILIIGTIVVFRQIDYARQRPVGYNPDGLLSIEMDSRHMQGRFDALEAELLATGAVTGVTQASAPATQVWSTNGNIHWRGKDPSLAVDFPTTTVRANYGRVMGWKFAQGRDFSKDFASDSAALIVNEAAVKYMGLEHAVGETIRWNDMPFTIVGVISDVIAESPYAPVRPSMYRMDPNDVSLVNLRLHPGLSSKESVKKIGEVFGKFFPERLFDYQFVDQEYGRKFESEQRIGTLAGAFAILAVFICCLGLFGMASFMAERRTKEIGVRKVMGASVVNLWAMLSKDFLVLVFMGILLSMPLAYFFMHNWLQGYQYRSDMSWWIFAVAGIGVLLITLLTVSFQSVKAALMNPVKSLRAE